MCIVDLVLVRNYQCIRKFDPYFLPEPFIIQDVNRFKVTVERRSNGLILTRHPDDLKLYKGNERFDENESGGNQKTVIEERNAEAWNTAFEELNEVNNTMGNGRQRQICIRRQNTRYFNDDLVNEYQIKYMMDN